jgi:hypothetical protein
MSSNDRSVTPDTAQGEGKVHDVETAFKGRGSLTAAFRVAGPGRPIQQQERIAEIVAKARELGGAFRMLPVAQALGKVDEYGGEITGDFKRDVRAAGGWKAIALRARQE